MTAMTHKVFTSFFPVQIYNNKFTRLASTSFCEPPCFVSLTWVARQKRDLQRLLQLKAFSVGLPQEQLSRVGIIGIPRVPCTNFDCLFGRANSEFSIKDFHRKLLLMTLANDLRPINQWKKRVWRAAIRRERSWKSWGNSKSFHIS